MATKATRKKNPNQSARVPERPVKLDAAHCWLERSNPLAGVSIRTAQSIFDCARSGDTQRLHWLYQEIEAVNPILFTCIERRQSAIAGYIPKFAAIPSMEGDLADEQKDAAETFLSGIDNFIETLEHLDSAFFRGFALAQPIWEEDGTVREIVLHNSWEFLVHDGILYHNPECDGFSKSAVSCADAGLIGIQAKRAIDYPALAIHIRQAVSERDWGRFLERYALPKPAVNMAPNATVAQRDDYLLAARAVENGQVSVWPYGTTITDFAGGSRGTDPFLAFIDHQEKEILKLATGGTLGTMAESGSGTLAGGAQQEVWRQIVQRDSTVLAQAVMRSMVKPYLVSKFGAQPIAIGFSLDFPTERSAKDAADLAATLKNAGWRVDQGELEKAVGFTLEREDSPQMPSLAKARGAASFKTTSGAFKTPSSDSDGQVDPQGQAPAQIAKKRPSAVDAILAEIAATILDGSVPYEAALKSAQEKLAAMDPDVISGDLEQALEEAMFKAAAAAAKGANLNA